MSLAENTASKQRSRVIGTPFPKGVSGNPAGRPKGARAKLAGDFITALAADFEANGAAAIIRVREEHPQIWLRVVADLLPKQSEVDINANVSVFTQAADTLTAFRLASELLGVNPARGLRRLREINPEIEHDGTALGR